MEPALNSPFNYLNFIMVTVSEAKKIIQTHTRSLPAVWLSITSAAGKILAEDVFAPGDFPPFFQSSMDGYAFRFEDFRAGKPLKVEGEMAAGAVKQMLLPSGTAARIFTGAPLPEGADTVTMQEKSRITEGTHGDRFLLIEATDLVKGVNVRPMGSEIRSGSKALEKGSLLTPAAIGFLAGIGISELLVIPHPSITLIVTGKELQQTGRPLQFGQVYESNSLTLSAALQQFHFENLSVVRTDDDINIVTRVLEESLEKSDLVLLSGGISVGDYDFVLEATRRCGVKELFHKVKQRPGKPLFFGSKDAKLVFGLPGNPSSVLACFYEYVLAALEGLTQMKLCLKTLRVPLGKPFEKTAGLTHFLKGIYDGKAVEILGAQESFRLSSFARANCLVQIEEETMMVNEREEVEIHLLP